MGEFNGVELEFLFGVVVLFAEEFGGEGSHGAGGEIREEVLVGRGELERGGGGGGEFVEDGLDEHLGDVGLVVVLRGVIVLIIPWLILLPINHQNIRL